MKAKTIDEKFDDGEEILNALLDSTNKCIT